jgi:hypothetical protein
MTMSITIKQVRDRAAHYLAPDVAAVAGMSVEQLQRFVSVTYQPTSEQLEQLARRMGVSQ